MVDLSVFVLTLILGLALVLQLLAIAKYFFLRKKLMKNIPNGNMGWLLVGETLAFLKPHKSNTMGVFLQQHCSRYGRVFKSHLFGSPAIVSCDLELNMFILKNEGKLFQASYPKQMHGILGDFSLFFVSGDHHKRLRRFVTAFVTTSKSSLTFLHSVEKLTISMMESWKGFKEVSFCKDIKKFTLNLIVKNLLSIEPEEPLALNILQDFQTYMKGFLSLPLNIPGSPYAKAVKARARLSSYVKGIIKSREEEEFGSTKGDFLDEILSSKCKPGDEEIVSVVLDILLGGYETTSTLISLILYFLAHSPKLCKFLKEEHETIRKSKKGGEPLDLEDYQKMEFTQNVMLEAMRCGNVVKFVHRKAIQEVRYKDYIIPSGWKVLPIFTGAHFDPSLHENPYEFNPWRWNNDETRQKVTPFGGGPRLCPGAEVAKIETAFFLHHLVLNYRWRVKDDDDFPMAYPYVEFCRGLLLEIEPLVPAEQLCGSVWGLNDSAVKILS